MKWLYTKWWKWLCVVLLFYILIGGMTVPLAPGISQIRPSVFKPDSIYTFTITGYNSHFTSPEAGKVQLWFKSGADYYCPKQVKILSDNTLQAQFDISSQQQQAIKDINFDIVLNDDIDGTFALREGTTLIKSQTVDSAFTGGAAVCDIEVKHN